MFSQVFVSPIGGRDMVSLVPGSFQVTGRMHFLEGGGYTERGRAYRGRVSRRTKVYRG